MKQIFNLNGNIVVEEVPAPTCNDNEVLVNNLYSVISVGTESMSLQGSGKGIMGIASKAINNPELVHKAIEMAKKEGLSKTIKIIKGQGEEVLTPLGYSSSGIVLEVGKNITDIAVGDRVACAGAGYANHAEVVSVPRNLLCKIPDNVEFQEAAFTTLGAIAMQGIRRAQVQFGDIVVVIGLGLLGQIACQILKSAGAHVIGIDLMKERVELAKELSADICFLAGKDAVDKVIKYTDGIGADSIIIYAATSSNEPVKQAMQMARKKGRVVVVGAVGMELDRSPFYEKELDFLISCSYGPGRYDPLYEEKGVDYPIGYVRWTENRNMQEFLKMLAEKKVNVKRLIDYVFSIEDAKKAYETLKEKKPIGVLFKYKEITKKEITRKITLKPYAIKKDKINVAVIGAGSFAKAYHLPNLRKIPYYNIRAIVTKAGNNAKNIAKKYDAEYCSTDYKEVLNDEDIDMVLIATRHDLHAPIIIDSANAGKHIFTEKPIALSYEDCMKVYSAIAKNKVNLTIGFNRRFSPLAQKAKKIVEKRKDPLMITYRVNSAGMKKDHWINDPVEGGGAIIGEGCHFFDFFNWIIGAEPKRIYAEMISNNNQSIINNNNVISTINYKDGSIASLIYTTIGNQSFPKERIEIFVDGEVICIDDFKELTIAGLEVKGEKLRNIEKGQFELIYEFGKFLKGESEGVDLPTVEDGVKATICSLKTIDALKSGKVQNYSGL